jgi:hypothetical protein
MRDGWQWVVVPSHIKSGAPSAQRPARVFGGRSAWGLWLMGLALYAICTWVARGVCAALHVLAQVAQAKLSGRAQLESAASGLR